MWLLVAACKSVECVNEFTGNQTSSVVTAFKHDSHTHTHTLTDTHWNTQTHAVFVLKNALASFHVSRSSSS